MQRAHKNSRIRGGAQRKLTLQEFLGLLHDAFSFLSVKIDESYATDIFKMFDTDRDAMITYV